MLVTILVNLVVPEGLEPSFPANQAGVLPVRQTVLLAPRVGLEPTTQRLTAAYSTN